ncbi:universal stress protein a [Trichococcus palustris]|jgi:nucleotide-binding universal stress UspA family protein|uniref:Universal stress protein n=2 Tax=Trichococcus palustris TaxID=140314 RepID=A0A143Y589_9LACT|nr:universal stress protein a [Trichococcus palustris]SFL08680.1 Nucleotide-binding universal stress protein, UspA family [Trichococcus palustris]
MDMSEYKSILVPVDGSETSISAFKQGVHIAERNKADLYLVAILDKMDNAEEAAQLQKDKDSLFDELDRYARAHGVAVHKDMRTGDPKELISKDLLEEWNIDLIVMGATGKGAIAKLVVGSVTNHVIRNAPCDLLIVRKSQQTDF